MPPDRMVTAPAPPHGLRRFDAAIFDLDGLLIDSERAIMNAWIDAARDAGVDIPAERYRSIIGQAAPQADRFLTDMLGSAETFSRVNAAAQARLAGGGGFPAKPGARQVLGDLAAIGLPCAVASSTALAKVTRRLAAVKLDHHFQSVSGGDEVPCGKPDPAVYLLAARRLGVAPERCLAFEDSLNGATAARAAGMQVIVVPDLAPRPQPGVALEVLASLEDARVHLRRWFQGAT